MGLFIFCSGREEIIPYKNITLIINGEARNFTITAQKTETRVYRFEGCADLAWNCTRVELQNGTVVSNCTESPVWTTSSRRIGGVWRVSEEKFMTAS